MADFIDRLTSAVLSARTTKTSKVLIEQNTSVTMTSLGLKSHDLHLQNENANTDAKQRGSAVSLGKANTAQRRNETQRTQNTRRR